MYICKFFINDGNKNNILANMKEVQSMNKKLAFTLLCIFSFFYILNYLTPMAFGDDYVYSFVWEGHSMFVPMSEQARRLSSFHDLLASQWSHYLTGNGRTISHTIAQFFLWVGKDIFNIFNALISVLLIIEIYWCSEKGKVTFCLEVKKLCFITSMLWIFSPGFSPVFFWLSGACNYLWTAVLLLGFVLPYIHKYYFMKEKVCHSSLSNCFIFVLGIMAGWTNENSICWIILVLSVFVYKSCRKQETEIWMLTGLIGLVIGYAFLILAPGNVARLHAEVGQTSGWLDIQVIKRNLKMLMIVFGWQFLMWYFNLRSLLLLSKSAITKQTVNVKKELVLVIVLCSISFCMSGIMLFSPNFPPRSSFPGTVLLVIAACILLRIQHGYAIELINLSAKRLLSVVGVGYILISSAATFYGFYDYNIQVNNLLMSVQDSAKRQKDTIIVNSLVPVSETIVKLSGFHLLFYKMSVDEKDWRNVAFARYYGIKAVRMID